MTYETMRFIPKLSNFILSIWILTTMNIIFKKNTEVNELMFFVCHGSCALIWKMLSWDFLIMQWDPWHNPVT